MTLDQYDQMKSLLLEALAIAEDAEGADVLALYIVHTLDILISNVRR